MDYREIIAAAVSSDESILEIGPSYNPIAPKRKGFRTTVVDHLDQNALKEKYRAFPVDIGLIEEVDVVASDLKQLQGRTFDSIIASHLIEHTADLIAFLEDCAALLKPSGTLHLIVPDKRFCFDRNRPLSTTGQVLDAHLLGRKRHVGALFDQFAFAVSKNGISAWGDGSEGELKQIHTFDEAMAHYLAATSTNEYLDAHEWVFTPSNFRLICHDLNRLGLTEFVEAEFQPSVGCEFYVSLRRSRSRSELSRQALLDAALDEERGLSRPTTPPAAVPISASPLPPLPASLEWLRPAVARAKEMLAGYPEARVRLEEGWRLFNRISGRISRHR